MFLTCTDGTAPLMNQSRAKSCAALPARIVDWNAAIGETPTTVPGRE